MLLKVTDATSIKPWLRCYRCWSTDLEVQVHYEGIHKIDPETGERADVVDELQEAVVQCLDCMHDQPHLGFANGRVEPVEDRWERMIAGTPWVASVTVTVDADDVETCSGPEAGDSILLMDRKPQTIKITAKKGTTLHFICALHPWMQGTIKVK